MGSSLVPALSPGSRVGVCPLASVGDPQSPSVTAERMHLPSVVLEDNSGGAGCLVGKDEHLCLQNRVQLGKLEHQHRGPEGRGGCTQLCSAVPGPHCLGFRTQNPAPGQNYQVSQEFKRSQEVRPGR